MDQNPDPEKWKKRIINITFPSEPFDANTFLAWRESIKTAEIAQIIPISFAQFAEMTKNGRKT